MEKYEIADGKLIILNDDMAINFAESFDLHDLPKDLNSPDIHLEKNDEGEITRASLMKGPALHGQTVYYGENGIEGSCYYFEDKLHGPSIFYAKNNVMSESWFFHGQRQGKTKRFYENGNIYSLEYYKDNLLHGEQKYYYPSQQIRSFLSYENGKLQKAILYDESGKIKRKIDSQKKIDEIF